MPWTNGSKIYSESDFLNSSLVDKCFNSENPKLISVTELKAVALKTKDLMPMGLKKYCDGVVSEKTFCESWMWATAIP